MVFIVFGGFSVLWLFCGCCLVGGVGWFGLLRLLFGFLVVVFGVCSLNGLLFITRCLSCIVCGLWVGCFC